MLKQGWLARQARIANEKWREFPDWVRKAVGGPACLECCEHKYMFAGRVDISDNKGFRVEVCYKCGKSRTIEE